MPVSDPIGDLLTRIRNAQAARHLECSVPWSRLKQELLELLLREGFFVEVSVEGVSKEKVINISFSKEHPKLHLRRVSTPGHRIYGKMKELRPVLRGYGIAILSTSEGLLTDMEARRKKIGGEILCTIA